MAPNDSVVSEPASFPFAASYAAPTNPFERLRCPAYRDIHPEKPSFQEGVSACLLHMRISPAWASREAPIMLRMKERSYGMTHMAVKASRGASASGLFGTNGRWHPQAYASPLASVRRIRNPERRKLSIHFHAEKCFQANGQREQCSTTRIRCNSAG